MIDIGKFSPKTIYVIYIASTPEKVWQALIDPAFTTRYFFGFKVDVEPKKGGAFFLRHPDGRIHVRGEVAEWSPPMRLSCSWALEGMAEFGELPECLVTYDIADAGESVRLTMTESHSWDVPEAILAGGASGWPAILSSLKSLLEIGKPLSVAKMGPPAGMIEAVKKAVAEKAWLKA